MKKHAALCFLMLACLTAFLCGRAEAGLLEVGDRTEDFAVELCDGTVIRLHELLESKDAVLIYFQRVKDGKWSFLQKTYEKMEGRVAIILLDPDEEDLRNISPMRKRDGLADVLLGRDTGRLHEKMCQSGAGEALIDRFGVICWLETDNIQEEDLLVNLLTGFVGDDYAESAFNYTATKYRPTRLKADSAALSAAANAEGSELVFSSVADDPYCWPFEPGEDGVCCPNAGEPYTITAIETELEARAGEVFTFRVDMNTLLGENMLYVFVDGEKIGSRSGVIEDGRFAWEFPADGRYSVRVRYENAGMVLPEASVRLSDFVLLSGEEARAALDAAPRFPKGGTNQALELVVLNDAARRLAPGHWEHSVDSYVVFGDSVDIKVILGEGIDPYQMGLRAGKSEETRGVDAAIAVDDEGYIFRVPLPRAQNGQECFEEVFVLAKGSDGWEKANVRLFADEENANYYQEKYLWVNSDRDLGERMYEDGARFSTDAVAVYPGLGTGDAMADFHALLSDGTTITLKELMEGKDAAIVCFCDTEERPYLPLFEEAGKIYGDSVAFLVLAAECDTLQKIRADQEEGGWTHVLAGIDSEQMRNQMGFGTGYFWALVDRFGVICYMGGRIQGLCGLIEGFVGDGYEESAFCYRESEYLPAKIKGNDAALSAALNAGGGTIAFETADDPYLWPFLPAENGAYPASVGTSEAVSGVRTRLEANKGDAFAFHFEIDTLPARNELTVLVDSAPVGVRSGACEARFVYEFATDGVHEIEIRYETAEAADWTETVILRDFVLLRGEEARAALIDTQSPAGTVPGNGIELMLLNENARRVEIVPGGLSGSFAYYYNHRDFYVLAEERATVRLRLGEEVDESRIWLELNDAKPRNIFSASRADGEGYVFEVPLSRAQDGKDCFTEIVMHEALEDPWQQFPGRMGKHLVLFADEENLDFYCQAYLAEEVGRADWRYADDTMTNEGE